jgi:conjugative transfer pilus assembly protein TraH
MSKSNKRLGRKAILLALCVSLAWTPVQTNAGWLQDFYNDSQVGAGSPGAFTGQTQNLYTGGSLTVRVPNKNYQLYSFNPPRFNVRGCGGIDVFAGSFSHINKAQFVGMLKNIGQQALSMAFFAALKGLSPEIAQTIEYLQDVAKKENHRTINSCEMAKALVNPTAIEQWGTDVRTNMRLAGPQMNAANDAAESESEVNESPDALSQLIDQAKSSLDGYKPQGTNTGTPMILRGNIVWRALSHQTGIQLDNWQKEFIMSLVGTYIYDDQGGTPDPAGGVTANIKYIPPTIADLSDLIGDGTSGFYQKLSCDNGYADDACTQVTIAASAGTEGFGKIVGDRISAIKTAMEGRTAITQADIDFANATSLPIQQMLSISVMQTGNTISAAIMDRYRDTIAAEYAATFMINAVKTLHTVIASAKKDVNAAEAEQLDKIEKRANEVKTYALAQLNLALVKSGQAGSIVNDLQFLERAMYSGMPSALQSSLSFDRQRTAR